MRNVSTLLLLTSLLVPAAMAACSSDDTSGGTPDSGPSTGGGGVGAGGAIGTGGKATNTGGARSTGGSGGKADEPDASTDSGDSTGGTDASIAPEAGPEEAGVREGGSDASKCEFPRCQPAYPEVIYPEENPQGDAKALLGKILFWDQQIGQLDTMACGSCHRSNAGGSIPASAQAHLGGFDGKIDADPANTSDDILGALGVPVCDVNGNLTPPGGPRQATTRKPPSYFDAMFASQVFWDGRAGVCKAGDGSSGGCFYDPDLGAAAKPVIVGKAVAGSIYTPGGALESQALGPPLNSAEMACANRNWPAIAVKLKGLTNPLKKATAIPVDMKKFITDNGNSYPQMFKTAFGSAAKVNTSDPDEVINTRRIVFAIATHERRLTSNRTPYDRWNAGDDSAMTAGQIRGFTAFMGKARCSFCHAPPLFTDNSFHNIGFHKPAWDAGRKAITGADADLAAFKTPTLRNVKLREAQGLLHNGIGAGKDLETVMALYKAGGFRGDTDIVSHIDPGLLVVPITAGDIADIIDFMRNALTDPRVEHQCTPFDRPAIDGETAVQGPCP
jgi:cytochrome c peroxidase